MSQNRGKQKKAAKKKKKREVAKARNRDVAPVDQARALAREAAQFPPGPSYINASYQGEEGDDPELVSVIVTRAAPGNLFIPALVLVDRTCLGIKDAFISRPLTKPQLDRMIEGLAEVQGELVECDFLTAQSIVFHAIDYAKSLGFLPHRDFPEPVFGPRPEALLDTPFAKPDKPLFITGPDDDVERIVAQLERAVGEGNFDLILGDEMDEEPLDVDDLVHPKGELAE